MIEMSRPQALARTATARTATAHTVSSGSLHAAPIPAVRS
jgi:hypothetical protein